MIGITKFAADALGDIVYVDLPDKGKKLSKTESVVSQRIFFTIFSVQLRVLRQQLMFTCRAMVK